MNQISSRFSKWCRTSSLLRKTLFTRWPPSSKFIPSCSSNRIKVFISKLHHYSFNYPCPTHTPQIPGNHCFRKFSGEAASVCHFQDDDHMKNEIEKVQSAKWNVQRSMEGSYGASLDALEDLTEKFNALMEKLGLATLEDKKEANDYDNYPHHLQRFRKEIEDLVESVQDTLAYAEFVAAGGDRRWDHFEENYECMLKYPEILASLKQLKIRSKLMRELIGYPSVPHIPANHHSRKFSEGESGCNIWDDDYLENEIWEVRGEQMGAQGDVAMGDVHPLDAVKVLADKFNSLMEKLGLETLDNDEHDGDFPPYLQKYRKKIYDLEYLVDMTVAYGEYVAAGGSRCWYPFRGNYRCMIKYEEILASLRQMKIRSRLMRRLIVETSESQSTINRWVVKFTPKASFEV